ncbi:MAG: ABC transporter permease [Deltaproteobacteria bacterium]|nr:ABC transporter permease [Deltaproteobacteria bacterium]
MSSAATNPVPPNLLRGLWLQAEVVHALALRETRTRFGGHKLGYLWALVEPTLIILTLDALFRVAGRATPVGMDIFSFIVTGLVPYHLFSASARQVAESINGNRALLFYPPVQPLDLAIARAVLEGATYFMVFVLLMGAHALVLQRFEVDDLLTVLWGFGLASFLGASAGLVFCCLGQISNAVDRARGPLLRPLFWISGVFFTAESLPAHIRKPALYNPVFHTVELVRAGWFSTYGPEHASSTYVLAWIGVLAVVGLVLERLVRRRIELT